MDIAEFLPQDRVIAPLYASDKTQLLQELARRAAAVSHLPQKTIFEALEAREKLGSTGLGQGFALPHARIEGLNQFVGFFARLAKPIPYAAVDEKPVDLVFLLLIPAEAVENYVSILAAVARRIRDQDLAKRLRTTDGAAGIHALLVNH